ncbi:Hypothetical predicted protein, partial [Marmota monax]
ELSDCDFGHERMGVIIRHVYAPFSSGNCPRSDEPTCSESPLSTASASLTFTRHTAPELISTKMAGRAGAD